MKANHIWLKNLCLILKVILSSAPHLKEDEEREKEREKQRLKAEEQTAKKLNYNLPRPIGEKRKEMSHSDETDTHEKKKDEKSEQKKVAAVRIFYDLK